MKIIKEFREFAVRGSVVDLAVGVIIGGAFQKIVSSLVGDIITPLLSLITGKGNLADLVWTLPSAPWNNAVVAVHYGNFLQNIIDFVLVAFVIFLIIKGINSLRRKPEPVDAMPPAEERLLTEIRDLLRDGHRQ